VVPRLRARARSLESRRASRLDVYQCHATASSQHHRRASHLGAIPCSLAARHDRIDRLPPIHDARVTHTGYADDVSDQNDIREGWIIAGELDGVPARPRLLDDVCGIPHVLRLACDLAFAGATKITVIWNESGPLPDLASVAADPRLASRAKLEVLRAAPTGAAGDLVVVARADRMFHRDMPKLAISASRRGTVGKSEGDENDAVFATDRATAARLVGQIRAPRGLVSALSRDAAGVVEVPPPYAGFTARVSGPGSLAHAE
jgi:hypothetical protein